MNTAGRDSISASSTLSDCWNEYSIELPLIMWRIFVWLTGRRCCFFIILFHVQTYGSPSMRTATPGFTSLYEIIAIVEVLYLFFAVCPTYFSILMSAYFSFLNVPKPYFSKRE